MNHSDFRLDLPLANRVIDIQVDGVNQTDVWVQNIDSNGLVVVDWTKVPSVNGFNVIYNSVDQGVRNIFSVNSRDNAGNDQISLRFADGNFGNVPTGVLRAWYRVSNGLQYQIRPSDMSNMKFNFTYTDMLNNTFSLAFNTALQYTVANSQATETIDQIKLSATQTYYTQDRMVNGEDYNLFPLQSSQSLKVKAINRTYSGMSKYLDINDPTGSYQNTNVLGTDGILYRENDINRQEVVISSGIAAASLVANYIQPMLNGANGLSGTAIELRDFFYLTFPLTTPVNVTWKTFTTTSNNTTGALFRGGSAVKLGAASTSDYILSYITTGSLLKYLNSGWVSVTSIVGDGDGINGTGKLSNNKGAVTLSKSITVNDSLQNIYPAFRTTFTTDEIVSITSALDRKSTFGIRYDALDQLWVVITNDNLSSSSVFSLENAGDQTSTGLDASWLIKVQYNGTSWVMLSRAMRYVFESVRDTRFYFVSTGKVINPATGLAQYDSINVLGVNSKPDGTSAIGTDYLWKIKGQEIYSDGYAEPRSVRVTFWDSLVEGTPDNPEEFSNIASPNVTASSYLFWQSVTGSDGYQYYDPISIPVTRVYNTPALVPSATDPMWTQGELAYVISTNVFLQWSSGMLMDVSTSYKSRVGRNNLTYVWKHYAPYDQRIDPAIMNVVDIYILTASYDTALRNWISTNGATDQMPTPPNTEQLKATFSYFEQFKMMTDQIVWHPVTYKILFGSQAVPELQVIFKVVKTAGTTISDNEVKSLVKTQIDDYFALTNWDFGQSFFFTELATYIHMKLATVVGSIVIVPRNGQSKFGDLFEISANPDEIFISGARVSDIQIVTSLSETQLGINNG
jgi:hypothetical protein